MQENTYAEMIIKLEEGYRQSEYHCSEGFRSIGFGRKLSSIKYESLTNQVANEKEELKFLRERNAENIGRIVAYNAKAWNNCNMARQAVLLSLAYQLGIAGLMKFKKMWLALERNDFESAAKEMLDSLWAKQTPNRARRQAKTMRDGSLDMYYITAGALH